jgi:hypothetical protein
MVLTPPNLRQTYAYGGYSSPAPFRPRQIGRFFVTPVEPDWPPERIESKLRGHNFGWITVVAVHEGYSGHHISRTSAPLLSPTFYVKSTAVMSSAKGGVFTPKS